MRLMRLPPTERFEAWTADDRIRLEMLEFRGVGTCLGGEMNEVLCPRQVAVVIGRDIGNEIRGMVITDPLVSDLQRSSVHDVISRGLRIVPRYAVTSPACRPAETVPPAGFPQRHATRWWQPPRARSGAAGAAVIRG